MDYVVLKLEYYIAFAGIWALANGLLHDVFVLLQRKPFDRELMRLLMDGHILIFTGVFYLLSAKGIMEHQTLASAVGLATAVFIMGYCALIFKILPSIVTILINFVAMVWLIMDFQTPK